MSLQDDVQTAANDFIAKVTQLVTDANYLDAIVTGPATGAGSTVTIGAQVLKTIARILAEAIARLGPFRGNWSNVTAYSASDVVRKTGIYVAMRNNTNVDPNTQTDGPDWYLFAPAVDSSFLAQAAWDNETDVASAATADIGSVSTVRVRVTGAVTITSFGAYLNRMRIVRFASNPLLTNGASLVLLTGANRQVAAGDIGVFMSDSAAVWREIAYSRADGTPIAIGAQQVQRSNIDRALMARHEVPLWLFFH